MAPLAHVRNGRTPEARWSAIRAKVVSSRFRKRLSQTVRWKINEDDNSGFYTRVQVHSHAHMDMIHTLTCTDMKGGHGTKNLSMEKHLLPIPTT